MTANHARKKLLRSYLKSQKASGLDTRYTKLAMLAAKARAFDIRDASARFDEKTLRAASYALMLGEKVVIFGESGTGKTAAAHGVMECLPGVPRVFFDMEGYENILAPKPGHHLKTSDPTHRVVSGELREIPIFEEAFAAFDDLRGVRDLAAAESHATLLLTVHARSRTSAERRLASFTTLDLTAAVYLRTYWDPQTGERSIELI